MQKKLQLMVLIEQCYYGNYYSLVDSFLVLYKSLVGLYVLEGYVLKSWGKKKFVNIYKYFLKNY